MQGVGSILSTNLLVKEEEAGSKIGSLATFHFPLQCDLRHKFSFNALYTKPARPWSEAEVLKWNPWAQATRPPSIAVPMPPQAFSNLFLPFFQLLFLTWVQTVWGRGLSHNGKILVLVVAISQVHFLVLPVGRLPPIPTRCPLLASDASANATAMPADHPGSYSLTPVNSYPSTSVAFQLPNWDFDLLCLPLQICCPVVGEVAVQVRNLKLAVCRVHGQTDKLGSYKPAHVEAFFNSFTKS